MADVPSRRCSLGTVGCSSRHPAEGSPSFHADGNRAQDAPTRRNEAKRRAEVKRVQKKSSRSEERPEEVQPKSSAEKKRLNPPVYVSLYPAYANIWITEGLWAEPRSPIGREKGGVNLP